MIKQNYRIEKENDWIKLTYLKMKIKSIINKSSKVIQG